MTYAKRTDVPAERSRNELVSLLRRYGAGQHYMGEDAEHNQAVVGFSMGGRQVRLRIPMPERRKMAQRSYEQACRTRWRAVVLVVKAKLELIELGISTIEREFLADIALPNGGTVSDWLAPQLSQAYATGAMPSLLPPANKGDA